MPNAAQRPPAHRPRRAQAGSARRGCSRWLQRAPACERSDARQATRAATPRRAWQRQVASATAASLRRRKSPCATAPNSTWTKTMSRPTSAHPASVITSLRLWRGKLKQDTAPLRAVFSPMIAPCAGVVAASVRRRTHPRAQVGVARLRLLRRPGVRHRTDAVRYVPYKTASHPGHHYVVPVNSASLLQEPAMKSPSDDIPDGGRRAGAGDHRLQQRQRHGRREQRHGHFPRVDQSDQPLTGEMVLGTAALPPSNQDHPMIGDKDTRPREQQHADELKDWLAAD